jgi:DNA end-binding protein Ku
VSIPVKLFSAAESSEKITFNTLHRDCGSRIQQQLFCPRDERVVGRDETAKGYEVSKGQYVTFSDDEIRALEEKASQQIEISEFLPSTTIDPVYFAKAYYLAPDKGGDRAYTLLARALQETGRWALGKYAARGKQYLVVLRPLAKGLVMQQLYYPNEVRDMGELDIHEQEVKPNELKMAVQLAEMGAAEQFRPEEYRDEVQERMRELIQRKIEGEEITAAPGEKPRAQVIDLMEALRASLAAPKPRAVKSAPAAEPAGPRKVATKTNIKAVADRKPAKAAPKKEEESAPAKRKAR